MEKRGKETKKGVELQLKTRVSKEVADWIGSYNVYGSKGNIVFEALEFYHTYLFYRKGFLIKIIQGDFFKIRHLLRKIGRIKKRLGDYEKEVR